MYVKLFILNIFTDRKTMSNVGVVSISHCHIARPRSHVNHFYWLGLFTSVLSAFSLFPNECGENAENDMHQTCVKWGKLWTSKAERNRLLIRSMIKTISVKPCISGTSSNARNSSLKGSMHARVKFAVITRKKPNQVYIVARLFSGFSTWGVTEWLGVQAKLMRPHWGFVVWGGVSSLLGVWPSPNGGLEKSLIVALSTPLDRIARP
jgi:hypothetical protein